MHGVRNVQSAAIKFQYTSGTCVVFHCYLRKIDESCKGFGNRAAIQLIDCTQNPFGLEQYRQPYPNALPFQQRASTVYLRRIVIRQQPHNYIGIKGNHVRLPPPLHAWTTTPRLRPHPFRLANQPGVHLCLCTWWTLVPRAPNHIVQCRRSACRPPHGAQ